MDPTPPTLPIRADDIVDTVREPLLVLGADLRVRRANRSFYCTFAVTPQETEGRRVYDLGNGQWDIPALRTLLEDVLPRQSSFDGFEVTHDFPVVGHKVMLLNARRVVGDGRDAAILLAIEDITERRRLEDERRELETRFTSLVKNVRDHSIFALDPRGHVTSWNVEAERVLGFEEAEVLGRHFSFIFTDEDRRDDIPEHELRTALSDGRAEDERWHVRKGGERFWALGIVTPIYDASGGHAGFSKILRDMTDRKRADEALRDSERRLRALATASGAVLYRMSADWSELQPLDGKRLVASTDAPIRDWLQRNIPESEHAAIRERFARCIAERCPFEMEHRVYRPDGSVGWTYSRAVPFLDDAGAIIEWVGAAEDVTARRQAEDALRESERRRRLALDSGELGAWHVDPVTMALTTDERFRAIFGVAGDRLDYERAVSVIHPDDQGRVRDAVAAATRPEDPAPYAVEYRVVHPDGAVRWVFAKGRANFDGVGPGRRITSFDGTVADVTERKAAEAERERLLDAERAARAAAERAGRVKDEFLATLSHELRTPLNAILGWAQILAQGRSDEQDLAEGLRVIERNARAQTQIIEDLLDMSRIISGKVRLDVQRLDLAAVVRAAVETVKPAADAKAVRLRAVLDPLAGPVSGDPNRLQQVFWNLLSNAVKFTPKGGQVQVLVERVNSHLEVSVTDTGEGITPEFLPHVFDRFRQADATTTRRQGGLGLGLAIVKQLVELHGGEIRAKSGGVGMGSTFVVSLPLTVIHPDPETAPVAERRHPVSGPVPQAGEACARLAGLRVLVVDDEPDARTLVERFLTDCDAVVTTAGSAREALDLLRAERPDVLVSDIGMPDEDGYALVQRVRALGPDEGGATPAIALTAYARAEDRMRAVMAGFQHHVVKPVEPAELITMVASLVARKPG